MLVSLLVLVGITGLPRIIISKFFYSIYILGIIAGIGSSCICFIHNIKKDKFNDNNIRNIFLCFLRGFIICILLLSVVIPCVKYSLLWIIDEYLPNMLTYLRFVLTYIDNIVVLLSSLYACFSHNKMLDHVGGNIIKDNDLGIKNKGPLKLYMAGSNDSSGKEESSSRGRGLSYGQEESRSRRVTLSFTDPLGIIRNIPSFRIQMPTDNSTGISSITVTTTSPGDNSSVTITSNSNSRQTDRNVNSNTSIPFASSSNAAATNTSNPAVTNTSNTTSIPFASSSNAAATNTNVSTIPFASSSNAATNTISVPTRNFNNPLMRFLDSDNVRFMNQLQERRINTIGRTLADNRVFFERIQDRASQELEVFYGNFLEHPSILGEWLCYMHLINSHGNSLIINYPMMNSILFNVIYRNLELTMPNIIGADSIAILENNIVRLRSPNLPDIFMSVEQYIRVHEGNIYVEYLDLINSLWGGVNHTIKILQHLRLTLDASNLDFNHINNILLFLNTIFKLEPSESLAISLQTNEKQLRELIDRLIIYNHEIEITGRRLLNEIRSNDSIFVWYDGEKPNEYRLAKILQIYYHKSGDILLFNDEAFINIFDGMTE